MPSHGWMEMESGEEVKGERGSRGRRKDRESEGKGGGE